VPPIGKVMGPTLYGVEASLKLGYEGQVVVGDPSMHRPSRLAKLRLQPGPHGGEPTVPLARLKSVSPQYSHYCKHRQHWARRWLIRLFHWSKAPEVKSYVIALASESQALEASDAQVTTEGVPAMIVWVLDVIVVNTA